MFIMKKKVLGIFSALLLSLLLAACGGNDASSELEKNDKEKAKAKTSENSSNASSDDKKEEEKSEEPKEDEIWTYYENAKWTDDFKGLKSEIMKVVVTDKAPDLEDESKKASAVGVKFKMENTTDGKFTTYPDQAVLVTSTGEQIDMPEMFVSDNLGGEIDKGVIKEGNIIWYLERGEAEKIEWIKMSWYAVEGDEMNMDGERKEYEVELKLK
jgi:hypothetical protein